MDFLFTQKPGKALLFCSTPHLVCVTVGLPYREFELVLR